MKIKDLLSANRNIILTCEEDLDKFLKIASQRRWHWVSGKSPFRETPKHCKGEWSDPYETVSIFIGTDGGSDRIVFGFTEIRPGDRGIDWFVDRFAPKPRNRKFKGTELLKWMFKYRKYVHLENRQEGDEFFAILKKNHWKIEGYEVIDGYFCYPCAIRVVSIPNTDEYTFSFGWNDHEIGFEQFKEKIKH